MLNLYRRHQPPCRFSSRRYRNCNCPIWVQGSLRGEYIRRALDLRSWSDRSRTQLEASGEIGVVKKADIPTTSGGADGFKALRKTKDIDRALPRLIVAVSMMEAFGSMELELTERELGAGLIIEAGLKAVADVSSNNRSLKTLMRVRFPNMLHFLRDLSSPGGLRRVRRTDDQHVR